MIMVYFVFCCCMGLFVMSFFFFKQKTAYEMRISDWSSDVCSSDLAGLLFTEVDHDVDAICSASRCNHDLPDLFPFMGGLQIYPHPLKIGRASCRERVCQYV